MNKNIVREFSNLVFRNIKKESTVSSNILNAQRVSNEQTAPPQRMSPYVGLTFYTRKWNAEYSEEIIDFAKSKIIPQSLRQIGREDPKQEFLFFENEDAYAEKYKEMKKIYDDNPEEYKSIIEADISKSDIYPYRGQLRPNFRMTGLLSEIGWVSDMIIKREYEVEELIKYYLHKIDYKIPDQYPHE